MQSDGCGRGRRSGHVERIEALVPAFELSDIGADDVG
jgi:hypothetical protein